MDNSVIGLMIVSVIAVFGLSAFYFDFVHPRRKPRLEKRRHLQK
ncbi:hypothetical protein [Pseudomonas syringae]